MCCSAMASSSPVLIPGRTSGRSSSRVCPTNNPATRILAIWSGVLISIPRSRQPIRPVPSTTTLALVDFLQRAEDALGDLLDLAHAVDLDQQPSVAVHLDQGLGLL